MLKLIINKKTKSQIDYLNSRSLGKEWSGILSYKIKSGTLINNNAIFESISIYPMHIGTYSSTEFNYNRINDVISHFVKEEPLFLLGTIHSHGSINAFISLQDKEEIIKNTEVFKNYLFVVVSSINDEYVAKIGREKIINVESIQYYDENGNYYQSHSKSDIMKNIEIDDIEVIIDNPLDMYFIDLMKNLNKKNSIDEQVNIFENEEDDFNLTLKRMKYENKRKI